MVINVLFALVYSGLATTVTKFAAEWGDRKSLSGVSMIRDSLAAASVS